MSAVIMREKWNCDVTGPEGDESIRTTNANLDRDYNWGSNLREYYHNVVCLPRGESKEYERLFLNEADDICEAISRRDNRFESLPIEIGSFFQGLKTLVPEEFDLNIALSDIGHFDTIPARDVDKYYLRVLGQDCPWELTGRHNLSGTVVHEKFRRLLQAASPRGVSIKCHGPAMELKLRAEDKQASVDFAVVVCDEDCIPAWTGWPRPGTRWPAPDRIQAVQDVGINWLALPGSVEWKISFAEAEKELGVDLDDDGGCRKKVHRIMKTMAEEGNWGRGAPKKALSSYILKNAWYWYMEDTSPEQWESDQLEKRFLGLVRRVVRYLDMGVLPQYFCPAVNLLDTTNETHDKRIAQNIRDFLENPAEVLERVT